MKKVIGVVTFPAKIGRGRRRGDTSRHVCSLECGHVEIRIANWAPHHVAPETLKCSVCEGKGS
jgi:hypothetical protein